jgi:tetratricopeptide (TPR) repeat protein
MRSVNAPLSQSPPRYAHHQLSRTYFIQGKLGEALEEAKKELEIYPDNTTTYYILGLTYGYMNREKEAIDTFSKYIETHPDTWAARNDKAWLQFRVGDIDGAIETIRPVADNTWNPWIQNTYGALLLNKKLYEEALAAFKHAENAANTMTEESWGRAYPGNDPRMYGVGLRAMKMSIEQNLGLARDKAGRQ